MLGRILTLLVFVTLLLISPPSYAQAEPALPSWNWDNPTYDATPWAPATITIVEMVALGVAVDLFFGGRVSRGLYKAALGVSRFVFSRAPAAAARPAGSAVVRAVVP